MIKNLAPSLAERGKIKIGAKGKMTSSAKGKAFQLPQKLDHFRVTTLQRGDDGNYFIDQEIHKIYGVQPKELKVQLLYDDIDLNFQTRYACFIGKKLWCTGDGETAVRISEKKSKENGNCPCGRQDPTYPGDDKCKINGCLNVIIDGAERVGGVWKFRTTSYNSVVGILSSLSLIKSITGGPLAGIPFILSVGPKTVVSPSDNKIQTIYVVTLEFSGGFDALRQSGYEIAKSRSTHNIRMENIETDVRKLLTEDTTASEIMDEDVVDEFYPEQAIKEMSGEEETQPLDTSEFNRQAKEHIDYPPDATLDKFIEITAKMCEITPDELKVEAAKDFEKFWGSFEMWTKKSAVLFEKADPKTDKPKKGKKAEQKPEPEKEPEATVMSMSLDNETWLKDMEKDHKAAYDEAVIQLGMPENDEQVVSFNEVYVEIRDGFLR